MKKINPIFVKILIDILNRMLQSQAMELADRAQVHGLLSKLTDENAVVDSDGDGIPDAIDPDTAPPRGFVVNAGEPTYEELLAAWRDKAENFPPNHE
jgi:hypothetical protein